MKRIVFLILTVWMFFCAPETRAQGESAPPPAPVLDINYFIHLSELLRTNRAALGTNLYAGGTNLSDVGRSITASGASALTAGAQSLGTNLDIIGKSLARFGTNLMAPHPPSMPYTVFISGGAEFMNPYQINGTSHALEKTGNNTVGFLEFNYINRFVLRDVADGRTSPRQYDDKVMGGHYVCPYRVWPDVQFSLGFDFNNGTTNYSATAIAGSGDFFSEATLALPVWQSVRYYQRQQVSIEASGGVVADKGFDTIHPNMFFGVGYQTSFRPRIGASFTNACGFFVSRAGAGWTDIPILTTSSGSTNFVAFDSHNYPKFDWSPHCSIQAYLAYPLTESLYLTVEANAYLTDRPPDSWNVKVGASIPLDKVATVFGSITSMWK